MQTMYRVIFLNINLQVTLDRWLEVHGTEENFEGSRAPVFKSSDFSGLTDRFKISFTGCYDKANNKFA